MSKPIRQRRERQLQLESLEFRRVLAQSVNFLGDLNTAPNLESSQLGSLVEVGGVAYFSAITTSAGAEASLWKSDGTAAGTVLVEEEIAPRGLINVGGTLFFAGEYLDQTQLWKSDGTPAGTVPVADVAPNFSAFANVNGTLFFVGTDANGASGLFKSDGTALGTTLLLSAQAGDLPHSLVNAGGTLYFNAAQSAGSQQRGLWKSNGTLAGTVRVDDSQGNFDPQELTNFNGTLLFSAFGIEGRELWQSNGTAAGTVLVKNLDPGNPTPQNPGDPSSSPESLTVVGSQLYFTAEVGELGRELYVSDGTTAGTHLVEDIAPAVDSSSTPQSLTNVSGTLYFSAASGAAGRELWRSDGTAGGTALVEDINPGTDSSLPSQFTNLNGTLLFRAANDGLNHELWRSDGTEGGTSVVKEIFPGGGTAASAPAGLANINGTLFFAAFRPDVGRELFRSDGTEAGTRLVKNVNGGTLDSGAAGFASVGATTYFTANFNNPDDDAEMPAGELWKSDGTAAGTVKFLDIVSGVYQRRSYYYDTGNYLTNVSGTLFFANGDALHGFELWKSDGTVAGTQMVKDIKFGAGGSFPQLLTNVNGTLYFRAQGTANNTELWKSDGTAAGTVMVVDLGRSSGYGSFGSYPRDLTNQGGTLFFNALGAHWKSNGTAAGTVQTPLPPDFVKIGSAVYYTAPSGDSEVLWKSNGTSAGTAIKTFKAAGNLTNVAGTLFFTATDSSGKGLWKTNGTAAGTVRLGPAKLDPQELVNVGGQLLFSAEDGTAGRELWKSDGTSAGTVRVRDILPGELGSSPENLRNVAGTLYFTATNGVSGNELWRSNGTAAGTFQVRDLAAGASGSHPQDLLVNERGALFFTATTPAFGREPYALPPPANVAPVLALSGSVGYVRDSAAITLAPNASVTDVDSPNFAGGRLRVRIAAGASSTNRLFIGSGFTVDANNNVLQGSTIIGKRASNGFGTNELIVTFNANATKAVVQQLVRAISFKTVGGAAGQRKVVFTVSDGEGGLSDEATKLVNVT